MFFRRISNCLKDVLIYYEPSLVYLKHTSYRLRQWGVIATVYSLKIYCWILVGRTDLIHISLSFEQNGHDVSRSSARNQR